ncbi:NADH-ubiquinone oxidoreductase-F iron-sulfur binding region domain-containing protein [Kineococcus arenarius]|uniref:NADH-ubiquinone oxidoreductase-F iron-sulfur binding region domain-containing protein n=1 Tax=unclassified Kineococcus TaxID=2621656 RepID=UPI003D7EE56A
MRVLAPCPPAVPDLHAHARLHGTGHRTRDLLTELERSGLRGRGGASRPLGPELHRVRQEAGRTGTPAVVVVNGVEGEPLSRKDAHLLRTEPHLVLDGAQAVATAVGAADVVVCAPAGPVLAAVDTALAERRATRWPLDRVPVRTAASAPGFVAGQESALVAHLDGRAARPRGDGVPLARRGLAGRPTLVKNVETLAHAALVARHGALRFREEGTAEDPGTLLLTLALPHRPPRVVEVPHGAPLEDVLRAGGSPRTAGVLLGGLHGGWVRPQDTAVPLTRAAVAAVGGRLGAGVVHVLPDDACPLVETARTTAHLAGQSVRQCGPCTFGLPRLAELTAALASCRLAPAAVRELHRTLGLLADRGACRHPDASARTVASALVAFAADVDAHAAGHCLVGGVVAA